MKSIAIVSVVVLAAAGALCLLNVPAESQSAGSFVVIQGTTPGTAQSGNTHVSGTMIVGTRVGIGSQNPISRLQVAGDVRIAPAAGQARLAFGNNPDNICAIIADPSMSGLILRDPGGARILPPNTTDTARILFGPTDDCSIGISPTLTGLLLRDPSGARLLPSTAAGHTRLLFGPTDDCSIEVSPTMSGLLLRDPSGARILPSTPAGQTRLLFGPSELCTIEISPTLPGLLLRDPHGARVLPPAGTTGPSSLFFGNNPDNLCAILVDPNTSGLILRDPSGARILPPSTNDSARLLFGPTDLCTIGISPTLPGLFFRDPNGFTLVGDTTRVVGNFSVTGNKQFRIDHPLDPENKYLNHYCTEGPEPYNVYSGTITTDGKGEAWVQLPDYFEAINKNPRYQLTIIDDTAGSDFVQVKVARKIKGNQFMIMTSAPKTEVCWEVKAVRNDRYNQKYGAPVEVEKEGLEKGKYLHPELYGMPPKLGMNFDAVLGKGSPTRRK